LSVNIKINLLSIVSPWLDKFYQISTKNATENFPKKFWDLIKASTRVYSYRTGLLLQGIKIVLSLGAGGGADCVIL
jgi:hypothetical protein